MLILGAVGSALAAPTISKISSVPQNIATEGFGDATAKALTEVSDSQKLSGRLIKDFTLERTTASLEEVMIAGVKSSDIANSESTRPSIFGCNEYANLKSGSTNSVIHRLRLQTCMGASEAPGLLVPGLQI
jgi:hypothetical protein